MSKCEKILEFLSIDFREILAFEDINLAGIFSVLFFSLYIGHPTKPAKYTKRSALSKLFRGSIENIRGIFVSEESGKYIPDEWKILKYPEKYIF